MQNPFEDLIPKNAQQNQGSQQRENPFADLIPQKQEAKQQEKSEPSFADQIMRAQIDQRSPVLDAGRQIKSDFDKAQSSPAKMDDRILRANLNQKSPFMPGKSESSRYGDVKENLGEQVGNSLMDYAPWLMTGNAATSGAIKALSKFPATAEGLAAFAKAHPRLSKYLRQGSENAISSAGYGGANAEEGQRGAEALKGAGLGLGFSLAGAGADQALKFGAKQFAQNAIPKFTEKATQEIRKLPSIEKQAEALEKKHAKAYGKNKENWTAAEKKAAELDEKVLRRTPEEQALKDINSLGKEIFDKKNGEKGFSMPEKLSKEDIEKGYFNSNPYLDYIENHTKKIAGMEPASRIPHMQSIDAARIATEGAPQSFRGAMDASKNINRQVSDVIKSQNSGLIPQNMNTDKFLGGLKNNLRNETIDANKGKVGEEAVNQFKGQWEKANKSNQDLQEFYKTPNKTTGVIGNDKKIKEAFRASLPESKGGQGAPLDQSIIGKYMPNITDKGYRGTQGIKQLGKIVGSEKQAKEAAISHIFKGQIENGAKTVDAAARYAQLSTPLKNYLFGKGDVRKYMDAVNDTRKAFGREPEKTLSKVGHGVAGWGVPPAIGYALSRMSGENDEESIRHAVEALGASKALKYFGRSLATPDRVNRAINFGKKESARTTNIGKNLNTGYNLLRYGQDK